MEITAEIIAGIKYNQHLKCNLTIVPLENFDVNAAKSSCVISHGQNRLAVSISTATKAKITITNYLGGKYFFTVDEILMSDENLRLIESKHSKSGRLPSTGDIKDGLLKMMLYSNLENVLVAGKTYKSLPVLRLTSENLTGRLASNSLADEEAEFFRINKLNARQTALMKNLFAEARENNFSVILEKG